MIVRAFPTLSQSNAGAAFDLACSIWHGTRSHTFGQPIHLNAIQINTDPVP